MFDEIQNMINYMVSDYSATNSKIKQKPYKVVMKLLLSFNGVSCHIANTVDIYNPFVLGAVDSTYEASRNKTKLNGT